MFPPVGRSYAGDHTDIAARSFYPRFPSLWAGSGSHTLIIRLIRLTSCKKAASFPRAGHCRCVTHHSALIIAVHHIACLAAHKFILIAFALTLGVHLGSRQIFEFRENCAKDNHRHTQSDRTHSWNRCEWSPPQRAGSGASLPTRQRCVTLCQLANRHRPRITAHVRGTHMHTTHR
jgi:hypothetical protein